MTLTVLIFVAQDVDIAVRKFDQTVSDSPRQPNLPAAMGFIKMKAARRRQLVSCVSYAMTGIVYAVVAGGLLSSPRLLRGLLQLDEVSLDALPFAPPNPSVPQSLRGLWWIDNGAGAVTVDLNRLRRDRRGQGFHVDDAAKNYQSVSNNLSGLRFWLLSALAGIRSHMPGDGTVTWSVLWGALPLPFEGPSVRLDEHEVQRSIRLPLLERFGYSPHLTTFSTYRIVDAAGEKTPHYAKMLSAMRAASSESWFGHRALMRAR